MKRYLGVILICVGTLLISASLGLLTFNYLEDRKAGEAAKDKLNSLVDQIRLQKEELPPQEEDVSPLTPRPEQELWIPIPTEADHSDDFVMEELEVDGNGYIGYICFPTLDLELPVMSRWTEEKLYSSPCHYYGSIQGQDLVIMAHNYDRHFGRLPSLMPYDPVCFVDVRGNTYEYTVILEETLPADCVPELTDGSYDLTLFTCTYGGAKRITIRCNRIVPD